MGKFEDALKRQVGRDTGKFISNMVYGDKHATPIRISVRQEKIKLEKERFRNERDIERLQLRDEQELKKKELEIQQEHLKQERLNQIRHEITQKLEILAEFKLPEEQEEVISLLNKWSIQLQSYSFWGEEEGKKYINQYMNALKYKYKQGIQKLVSTGVPESKVVAYQKVIRRYQHKRIWSMICIPVCLIGAFLFFLGLLIILD